jgi:hypothetical protein
MNAAYIHITLNTIPVILNVTGLLILLAGLFRKNVAVVNTALAILLASAITGVPVYYSGEEAEHIVEKLEGVNAAAIEPHEEAAKFAYIAAVIQAVVVIAALVISIRRGLTGWIMIVVVVVGLWSTSVVLRTAYLGGKIHHPETQMK